MKLWKVLQLAPLMLVLNGVGIHAINVTSSPEPFQQSLDLGLEELTFSIPGNFRTIGNEYSPSFQSIAFIPQYELESSWTRFMVIDILLKSNTTARQKMQQLKDYLTDTYQSTDVLNYDFSSHSTHQEALTTIAYTDEIGKVVVSYIYYSDGQVLAGIQVSQRVHKSINHAKRATEKLARQSVFFRKK